MQDGQDRKLIYFCVFGDDGQFEMMVLALRSVLRFGNTRCDYAVLTDEASVERLEAHLAPLRAEGHTIITKVVIATDLYGYTSARYKVVDFDDLQDYGPVLYLDTDMICDADLGSLFDKIKGSDSVSAFGQGAVMATRDVWGRTLFLKDQEYKAEPNQEGFNSGALGAPSMRTFNVPFREVTDHITQWLGAGNPPLFFDQPHANYTMIRNGHYVGNRLNDHIRIVGHKVAADPAARIGLAHFAGGVGLSKRKLPRMKAYFATLTA